MKTTKTDEKLSNHAELSNLLGHLGIEEEATTVKIMDIIKIQCERRKLKSFVWGVIPIIKGMQDHLPPDDDCLRRSMVVVEKLHTALESSKNLALQRKSQCPDGFNCSKLAQYLEPFIPS